MPPDYSGQNLRGRSFRGQNLEGANFSYADIRGVDFRDTKLKDANFSNARTGLTLGGFVVLFIVSLLFSILSGLFLPFLAIKISQEPYILYNLTLLVLGCLFAFWFIRLGLFSAIVVSIISAVFSSVNALAITMTSTLILTLTITIATSINKKVLNFILLSSLIASFPLIVYRDKTFLTKDFLAVLITSAASIALSLYMSHKAVIGDKKYASIRALAIALGASDSTRFQNSDLTNADFTGATLRNTNLLRANITGTCWLNVKDFDLVCFDDNTYLNLPKVRQLVITGKGQNLNLDHLNLNGINLSGLNLQDASFIGTELNNANLQDADLSRTILKQTQLDNTDLTGATLTGAFIEDWNITHDTNFRGVKCEYVYMRLPTKENPNPLRKPDNNAEVFADGEFGDFIQPIFDTLDLYHNQGVDPRAIAISFKQLAENNPDSELEIVAMEKRGDDKFLLRAKAAPEFDKSELSAEYFETYNYLKSLSPSEKIQYLLTELKVKDTQINYQQNQIISYENMINTALGRPTIQADTVNAEQIGGNIKNYPQKQTENSTVKTILILASNPKNTSQLRLDQEVREIDAGLQRAKKRELFNLKQRWSVRFQDVHQALLDFKPQIVHFSGHGSGDDGLILEDEDGNLQLVNTEAIANLFDLFSDTIECVVLNACYSEVQASAIAKYIPYVIGMNQAIDDKAAIKFATGFYNAIGAGESVEFAYKLGCNVIQLDGIPEGLIPVLKKR